MKRLFLWALLTRLFLSDGEKGLSIGSRSVPAFVCACARACACGVCVTLVSTSALVLPVLPADFPPVLDMTACVHVYISTHAYQNAAETSIKLRLVNLHTYAYSLIHSLSLSLSLSLSRTHILSHTITQSRNHTTSECVTVRAEFFSSTTCALCCKIHVLLHFSYKRSPGIE
jgi:hypothetical protein